jgi:O-acetyl-ADP-ribose deacetylase (regulator of RNase III)
MRIRRLNNGGIPDRSYIAYSGLPLQFAYTRLRSLRCLREINRAARPAWYVVAQTFGVEASFSHLAFQHLQSNRATEQAEVATMIEYVTGDILLSRAHALAHGIAPNDNFASGLALALRESWPSLYKDFRHCCHVNHPPEGSVWTWVRTDGRPIFNLFTQAAAYEHGARPGRATLENVNHALRELQRLIQSEHVHSLALPRLATGVGGLQWHDVEPLIQHHLGELPIPVYVYTQYHKGQTAIETTG